MSMTQSERAKRRAAIAEYAKTHDVRETALYFGVGHGIIYKACREKNVKPATIGKGSLGTNTLHILKQLLDGRSQAATALMLNVTRQRVHAVAVAAKAAGITLPEKSLRE